MRLLFFTLLLSALSFGQDRNGISYQALIINPNVEQLPGQDNDHAPLANADICLQFHITNSFGNYEYSESQSVTTDAYGMINLVIGTGTPTGPITWDAVNWSAEAKSLKVEIDFTATCSGFTLLSNQKLNYSPFSYYAINSGADSLVAALEDAVDQNELDSDAADATLQTNIDGVQADVDANEAAANTAIATVQADVDQNESDADTAIATVQADVAANTAKVGYTDALVSANTDVAANTAKVGYTDAIVSANTDVAANTAKVGYTDALVSANTDVAANTAKVGYTDALVSANTDVAANTAKVGMVLGTTAETALAGDTSLFSGSYSDLTDTPTMYTQAQVDALITSLQNQINDLKPLESITYGDQTWSVENAEMETYRDGTAIPQVTDGTLGQSNHRRLVLLQQRFNKR